jgi:glycosyltransferase involved in cell wall biosynthesis
MDTRLVSIIIPAYNEAPRIRHNILYLKKWLDNNLHKNFDYQIIVAEDGSTDATLEILQDLSKRIFNLKVCSNGCNIGKGYSICHGLSEAEGEFFVVMDADLSTNLECINEMLIMMQHTELDMAIGSRYHENSFINPPRTFLRTLYSRSFNFMIRKMFKLDIKDSQNGFLIYSKRMRDAVISYSKIKRFCFSIEHIIIAREHRYVVREFPVLWKDNKPQGFSKHIPNMFSELTDIYSRYKNKEYAP